MACKYLIELETECRKGNCHCVEAGYFPVPRCRLKTPEHWNGFDKTGTRWLWSGGSPYVFGWCTPEQCPSLRADLDELEAEPESSGKSTIQLELFL